MNKEKLIITVMCDYSADGLWLNGGGIDIIDLPKKVHFLKDRIAKWQEDYEQLMLPSLKRDLNKYSEEENEKFNAEINTSSEMKEFIQEGWYIAKILKKLLNVKEYEVEYFIENNSERITL